MESRHDSGSLPRVGQLVTCRLDELRPHPAYVRHHLAVSSARLSALAKRGDLAFSEPLAVTTDRTIIDGYARWQLALQRGRATLPCIDYDLSDEEALLWLLQRHCRSDGLNDFCRILLAQELESQSKEQARSNQKVGGRNKGSSNLTEAERVDVRSRIAVTANVSVGNVSKVRQLTLTAVPELLEALRKGEISIHRAWLLSKGPPANQRDELALSYCKRNIKKDMRALASQHGPKRLHIPPNRCNLIRKLFALEASKPGSFDVFTSRAQGRAVVLTQELLLELDAQQELYPNAKEPDAKADPS